MRHPRLLALTGLIVLLLGGGAAALHSEAVLRWTLEQVAARSGGALTIQGAGGTLLGPIRIAHLRYRKPTLDVQVQDAAIRWSPWRLLFRQLSIRELSARAATVGWSAGKGPAKAPTDLRAPLGLRIDQLKLPTLQLNGPSASQLLRNVSGSLTGGRSDWAATLRTDSAVGIVNSQLKLAARPPFDLDSTLTLVNADKPTIYTATARLTGTLTRIALRADAHAHQAVAHAEGVLTPFAPLAVERMQATANRIRPRDWVERAPDADLNVLFQAQPTSPQAIKGLLRVNNAIPGRIDNNRMPLTVAQADFGGPWQALELPAIKIDLGEGGQVTGSGAYKGGELSLALNSSNLDPRGLHSRWRSLHLAGNIGFGQEPGGQRLTAALGQGTYRFGFEGHRQGREVMVKQLLQAGASRLQGAGQISLGTTKDFRLTGAVTGFDPSRFGRFPKAQVNSKLQVEGALNPILQVKADWQLFNSVLYGQASSGKGMVRSKGTRSPDVAFDGNLAIGPTRAAAKGTVHDPAKLGTLDLQLALQGRSLGDLYPIIGVPVPATRAYSLSGRLTQKDQVWGFQHFKGKVGDSDLSGSVTVDRRRQPQFMKGDLVSNNLEMKDLAAFIGGDPRPGATQTAGSGRVLPAAPFNFSKLRAANANVTFRGRHIVTPNLPLDNMQTHLVLEDGRLTLDPLDFGVASGQLQSRVYVDTRQPVTQSRADVRVRSLELKQLMPKLESARASFGRVEGRAKLAMQGNSFAQMLGSADGDVTLMLEDGELSDLMLRLANVDLAHAAVSLLRGDRNIPVRCMVGEFHTDDGLMKVRTFALDTEHTLVTGQGDVNLKNETLNLQFKAQPKDASLVALRGPIQLDGRLGKPQVHADWKGIIGRSGLAVLLGAAAPPAALIPLIELGKQQKLECGPLVTRATRFINSARPAASQLR